MEPNYELIYKQTFPEFIFTKKEWEAFFPEILFNAWKSLYFRINNYLTVLLLPIKVTYYRITGNGSDYAIPIPYFFVSKLFGLPTAVIHRDTVMYLRSRDDNPTPQSLFDFLRQLIDQLQRTSIRISFFGIKDPEVLFSLGQQIICPVNEFYKTVKPISAEHQLCKGEIFTFQFERNKKDPSRYNIGLFYSTLNCDTRSVFNLLTFINKNYSE
jgi:hypothetical protein